MSSHVQIDEDILIIDDEGNGYNPKTMQPYYEFELENKPKGSLNKRYKYSYDDLAYYYGLDAGDSFKAPKYNLIRHVPGSLVRAQYGSKRQREIGWYVIPAESRTAYSILYDPFENQGESHGIHVGDFCILDEYPIDDIRDIRDCRYILDYRLRGIERAINYTLSPIQATANLKARNGRLVEGDTIEKALAILAYNALPPETCRDIYIKSHESPIAERLRLELEEQAIGIRETLEQYLQAYRAEKLQILVDEIKGLCGLDLTKTIQYFTRTIPIGF